MSGTGQLTYRLHGANGRVNVRYTADGPYQSWVEVDGRRHRIERAPVISATPSMAFRTASRVILVALYQPHQRRSSSKVPVSVGDPITAGDCVILLESMKMEVRVDAPISGTVSEILVQSGGQVKSGQALLIIEAEDGDEKAADTTAASLPWEGPDARISEAGVRVEAAVLGWDYEPRELKADIELLSAEAAPTILAAFADIAELFERRPTRQKDGGSGATDAVSPDIWMATLEQRGPNGLSDARKSILEASLARFGVEGLDSSSERDDAMMRLKRAGESLPDTIPAAVMALRLLEEAPIQLLDRLTSLDPSRFGSVIEAADRARYILFERLAHVRLLARAEHRARALLGWLREGEADWNEVLEAAESLVPGFAP